MKFKLVENYDQTREFVQEYAYEVMNELGNASLEEYIQWFMSEFTYFDDEVKQAVKDFYIEAIDCGKIDLPKTMITSQLKDYIESNSNLLDNVDELMNNCPEHLRHELQLALDVAELNESLTESLNDELLLELLSDSKFQEPIRVNILIDTHNAKLNSNETIVDLISNVTLQAQFTPQILVDNSDNTYQLCFPGKQDWLNAIQESLTNINRKITLKET